MNFAEAALLIQGSTCVYSKKVREEKDWQSSVVHIAIHRSTCDWRQLAIPLRMASLEDECAT